MYDHEYEMYLYSLFFIIIHSYSKDRRHKLRKAFSKRLRFEGELCASLLSILVLVIDEYSR